MAKPSNLNDILQRLLHDIETDEALDALRQWLNSGGLDSLQQVGKFNTNIGQGQGVNIGDRNYYGLDADAILELARAIKEGSNATDIRSIVRSILNEELPNLTQPQQLQVDELVQQVRTRFHDRIHSLHGTMPLWGIDHWVPLADLFVDVNILEEVSSNRRSELNDLWQDFTAHNSTYRSLDRIGLGKERQRVSGLTVLERNSNLMVVGKPGSGKTTYLQSIVTECNAGKLQAQRIPVLIKLREFVDDGRKYEYNLEQFLGQHCWRLSNADLELVLSQGRALVLLDGLDEITGENGKQIAKEIKRFARDHPQVQVVVTCRTQSQESRFDRFDYVEVADFNEQQVRTFAAHWFEAICTDRKDKETKAQEFLDQLFLDENNAIRELATTPILLSLTCAVFYQTGEFYSKRSKLYEEGLELLLKKWDESREIERDKIYRDLSVERKLELLSYIAVKKFEQKQYVLFEQEELEGYISEFLGIDLRESRAVAKAIESQHGLLIERAQKVWSFSHLTFQEYLVARWSLNQSDLQVFIINFTKQHYSGVFLLASEMKDNADELLIKFKEYIDGQIILKELQDFLNWVNHKSQSVGVFSQPAALRAFYLDFAFIRERYRDLNLDIINANPLAIDLGIGYANDLACYLSLDLDLIRTLNLVYYISPNSSEDFAYDLTYAMIRAHYIKIELYESLEQFYDQIKVQSKNNNNFQQWWKVNGQKWSQNLRREIIKYRNIGHEWNFSDIQMQNLEEYYTANHLLLKCVDVSNLSLEVRCKIEQTLLLPIAEIEKRKREKAE